MGRLATAFGSVLLLGMLTLPTANAQEFVRGDLDQNSVVDLADFAVMSSMLFGGGSLVPCLDSADTNDDGILDLIDILDLLMSIFGWYAIPAPTGECGPDPTMDSLYCSSISCP